MILKMGKIYRRHNKSDVTNSSSYRAIECLI